MGAALESDEPQPSVNKGYACSVTGQEPDSGLVWYPRKPGKLIRLGDKLHPLASLPGLVGKNDRKPARISSKVSDPGELIYRQEPHAIPSSKIKRG